jgi:hypothetical protein
MVLASVTIQAVGVLAFHETVTAPGTAPVTVTRTIRISDTTRAGEVTFTARSEPGSAQGDATAKFTVHERTPPKIVSLEISPNADLLGGDSIRVAYTATSPRGIREVSATVFGESLIESPTKAQYSGEKSVTGEFRLRLPAPVFRTATLRLGVRDTVGQGDNRDVELKLHAPPYVRGNVALPNFAPSGSPMLLVGDMAQIIVSAGGSTPLRRIGYSVGDPVVRSDSVEVSGNSAEQVFRVVADGRWQTEGKATLPITFFVLDQRGARMTSRQDLRVVPGIRRPTRTAQLPGAVADAVIDVRRNRAYLSVPSASQVAVLDLATMTFAAPIPVPTPAGIDLTPGGDSLVVALRNGDALAIVNLATRARTDVRLESSHPGILRVASNGKVFVLTAGNDVDEMLLEYDLRTGRQRRWEEVGSGGRLSPYALITRSGNGARVLVRNVSSGGGPGMAIYDAATDAFTVTRVPPPGDPGQSPSAVSISADREGRSFLVGVTLFPSDLSSARLLAGTGYSGSGHEPPPTVLAPSGAEVFVGAEPGFWRMRAGDAAVLERVWVYAPRLTRLVPHPDGGTILAFSEANAFLVDLR